MENEPHENTRMIIGIVTKNIANVNSYFGKKLSLGDDTTEKTA